jgi:hypothetical protein
MKAQLLDHLEVAKCALQSAAYIAEAKGWDELCGLADLGSDVESAMGIAAQIDVDEDTNTADDLTVVVAGH